MKERRPNIKIILGKDDALEAEKFLLECILIASDIETDPINGFITVIGYSGLRADGVKRTFVFPLYLDKSYKSGTPTHLFEYLRVCTAINASGIPFTFQNGGYDLFWFLFYGMPVANYAYDSMTMFWSLWPELPKRLDFICSILLTDYRYWKGARKTDNATTYWIYNGLDCDRTLDATIVLIGMLTENQKAMQNFWHAHMRVMVAISMSIRGIRSDEQVRADHYLSLQDEAFAALEYLRYLIADDSFNPNSVPQKYELLYKKLGVRRRTAKGKFTNRDDQTSTGAIALRSMRIEHPIIRVIVDAMMKAGEPAKQISNVIGMPRADWGNGNVRYHTGYDGVGTGTTRLSSRRAPIDVGGNLQNWRKAFRNILSADPGQVLLDIDFSAGDDVFVTFESADPKKIDVFRSGKDSHALNTTLFFTNWTYEAVVNGKNAKKTDYELYMKITHPITGIRQITKKLSHGCNYLMAAFTLLTTAGREAVVAAAKEIGYADAGIWTQDRLVDFCSYLEGLYRAYYTRFQREGSHSWYMDLKRELASTGGFTTAFNYFQRFLGDRNDESVLRAVAASAGQANTAGRINAVMEEVVLGYISPTFRDSENPAYGSEPLRVTKAEHGTTLLLQNHDSLTFQFDPNHAGWEEGVSRIFRSMARPVLIRNKLTGELEEFAVGLESEIGLRWGNDLIGTGNSVEAVKESLNKLNI